MLLEEEVQGCLRGRCSGFGTFVAGSRKRSDVHSHVIETGHGSFGPQGQTIPRDMKIPPKGVPPNTEVWDSRWVWVKQHPEVTSDDFPAARETSAAAVGSGQPPEPVVGR